MSPPEVPPAARGTPEETGRTLRDLYAARFSERDRRSKTRLWQVLAESCFQHYVPDDACVVDLGAGSCELINALRAKRRIALDLNPDVASFAAPEVEARVCPLGDLLDVVAAGSVDVAFASNVFEHLRSPEALLKALQTVRRALSSRGVLVIVQPNVRLTGGAFWDFLDHTLPLTEKGMTEALELTGYRVTECRARFLPYTTKSRLPQLPALVRLYLALRPVQWLLGKQMLIVAAPGSPRV